MTRKAFKALLIAATLGVAVALIVRSRRRPAAAVDIEQPVVAPESTNAVEAEAEPETAPPPPAPVRVHAVPDRTAELPVVVRPPGHRPPADVVEIDPDALPPVAVAADTPGPAPAPVKNRRSQRVVGGVLAAFVVTAVAVAGLAYSSVRDGDGDRAEAAATGGAPSSGAPSPAASTSFGPLPAQKFEAVGERSGGELSRMALAGRRSGVTADVWVWLPSQYRRADLQTKRFPVLVLHSAYPGVDANSLLADKTGLLAKLADAIERKQIPPFVVVAPELTPYRQDELDAAADPAALDTECSDIPGKARMATFHNEDVREAVAATFRVTNDRMGWALLGEGAGGLCAAKYALQYPQYYGNAASLSGRTTLKSPLWGSGVAARDAQSPIALLGARPEVRLFLSDNSSDTAGRQASTAVRNAAGAPTVVETATASGDSAKQVPGALTFFGRNVVDTTGFKPPKANTARPGNR